MNRLLISLFLCLTGFMGYAQSFKLYRGSEVKTSKDGSIFEVQLIGVKPTDCNKCRDYTQIFGQITSVSKDSFTMKVTSYRSIKNIDNEQLDNTYFSKSSSIRTTIANNDIHYIRNFKSYASQNRKSAFTVPAGLLITTGAVTALNTFVVNGKNAKRNLLISGGAQISLGVIFGLLSNSKKYYMNEAADVWALGSR